MEECFEKQKYQIIESFSEKKTFIHCKKPYHQFRMQEINTFDFQEE